MGTVKYSGPVASFHCPTEATIRSLKVHFSPKQLGSGTPSPENVREINGWNNIVYHKCKHIRKITPVNFTTIINNGVSLEYLGEGVFSLHGECTGNTAIFDLDIEPFNLTIQDQYFSFFSNYHNSVSQYDIVFGIKDIDKKTILNVFPMSNYYDTVFSYLNLGDEEIEYVSNNACQKIRMVFKKGITDITFSLIFSDSLNTGKIDFGDNIGEIYGGWVDLISGELVATHKKVHTDSNDTWTLTFYENAENHQAYSERYLDAFVPKTRNILISDKFSEATQSYPPLLNTCTMNENRRILLGVPKEIKNDEDFSTWFNNLGGADFIYQFAEPIHYSLTPTELQTFLSQNNIWSNADYVEVEYDLHETQNILARKQFIVANQPHIVKPAAAPLQNFVTDMAAPLKECRIYFTPVQEGEGDPSPENVRPISGWQNLHVTIAGKNLYDQVSYPLIQGYWVGWGSRTSGGESDKYACVGTTRSPDQPQPVYPVSHLGGTTITLNKRPGGKNPGFNFENADGSYITGTIEEYGNNNATAGTPWTITLPENAVGMRFTTISNDAEIQLELGSTATEYEPYHGQTIPITFPSEAGTIYGGYVDLIKGELVMTWECITLSPEICTGTSMDSTYLWYSCKVFQAKNKNQICSHCIVRAPSGSNWREDIKINYTRNNMIIVGETFFEDANIERTGAAFNEYCQQQIDNGTPLQIAAELAEPIHYSLTPQTLKTLRGTNNIWSSANGDVEVKYWTH